MWYVSPLPQGMKLDPLSLETLQQDGIKEEEILPHIASITDTSVTDTNNIMQDD